MAKARIELTNKETGEQITFMVSFTGAEWSDLENFVSFSDDLRTTKFVQQGMQSSLTLKYERDKGTQIQVKLPSQDELSAFLHRFRPFALERERTYYFRISKLLGRELRHEFFQHQLETYGDMFSCKAIQTQFQLRSKNVQINSEKILNTWLNAYEYHKDKSKRQLIEDLHKVFPLDASKVIFISLLTQKAMAILNLAEIIRKLLSKRINNAESPPSDSDET
jgi:hypothetical protein